MPNIKASVKIAPPIFVLKFFILLMDSPFPRKDKGNECAVSFYGRGMLI